MESSNEYRGPKIGDSASLWNFSPSPGWTKTEAAILRLCLMKYGVGKWREIEDSGLLPGKMNQQLYGQTQRLLGQQSIVAYTGLTVDIDRIRLENNARTGVERKAGLIIWSGPNPTPEMKAAWRGEAEEKYGLSAAQKQAAEQQLEEVVATPQLNRRQAAALPDDLMGEDETKLSREQKIALLQRLRGATKQMHAQFLLQPAQAVAPERNGGAGVQPLRDVSNGAHRAGSGRAASVRQQRAAGGVKRSRAGGVIAKAPKSEAGTQQPRGRPKGRGRRGDDVHEAPPNAAAEEARAAAIACDIARLEAMGFNSAKARDALEDANCDVDAAIEWLLVSCV